MNKKITALILCLAVCLALCACDTIEEIRDVPLPGQKEADSPATAQPTEAPAPSVELEETPQAMDLPNRVTVSISGTSFEAFDPQDGTRQILNFSYERPMVQIAGREEAANAVNEYLDLLDEAYYTGNDYGTDGSADLADVGYNLMLEMAEDNFTNMVDTGREYDAAYDLFYATRSAFVPRADRVMISLVYDSYEYTGGAHGSQTVRGYVFDGETGKLLSLEDLSGDSEALLSFLTDYMLGMIENDTELSQMIDLETAKSTMGVEDMPGACRALLRQGSWYFDSDGLVIFSDQNEMGPEVSGEIDFHVPYSALDSYIDGKWFPEAREGSGWIELIPLSQAGEEGIDIIDLAVADEDGESLCLKAVGAVYDVCVSRVQGQNVNTFFETGQLWRASHMSGCALQLRAALPEGMPQLMISYSSGQERHSLLLTTGEGGEPVLAENSDIEAVG